MDWKIELIFVPVSDIDRARDFYVKIGFHLDHDQVPFEGLRFVQLTPPGSACSIAVSSMPSRTSAADRKWAANGMMTAIC